MLEDHLFCHRWPAPAMWCRYRAPQALYHVLLEESYVVDRVSTHGIPIVLAHSSM